MDGYRNEFIFVLQPAHNSPCGLPAPVRNAIRAKPVNYKFMKAAVNTRISGDRNQASDGRSI